MPDTKIWGTADIPDLSGKVALVTGGNAGISEISVKELARHGAKVYLAARSPVRAQEAMDRLQKELQPEAFARIEVLRLDLADLESVKNAVREFESKEDKLHILMNSAGVMATPYSFTKQGTNVVGHALLTFMLLPVLVKTSRDPGLNGSVRITNMSSVGHAQFGSRPPKQSWASIETVNARQGRETFGTWRRYGMSKTGNILLAQELKKITTGEKISHLSLHPGNIDTDLFRGFKESMPWMKPIFPGLDWLIRKTLLTPAEGALTQLYAATSPDVDTKLLNGAYLEPIAKVSQAAKHATGEAGDVLGKEMMTFIKEFARSSVQVDIDALIRQALSLPSPP